MSINEWYEEQRRRTEDFLLIWLPQWWSNLWGSFEFGGSDWDDYE